MSKPRSVDLKERVAVAVAAEAPPRDCLEPLSESEVWLGIPPGGYAVEPASECHRNGV